MNGPDEVGQLAESAPAPLLREDYRGPGEHRWVGIGGARGAPGQPHGRQIVLIVAHVHGVPGVHAEHRAQRKEPIALLAGREVEVGLGDAEHPCPGLDRHGLGGR